MSTSLFLADAFEVLQTGKVMAMGLYTDKVMVLTVPAHAPEPSKEQPYAIALALLLCVTDLPAGEYKAEFSIELPSGGVLQNLPFPAARYPVNGAEAFNLILKFAPFMAPEVGTYTLLGRVGDVDFRHTFELREKREAAQITQSR